MAETKIEWADYTFNSWEGCVNVSPACDGCYAQGRDIRLHHGDNWGKDASRLFHADAYWKQPIRWNREAKASGVRRRVFCGSLMDIMEDRRDLDIPRARTFELFEQLEWLDLLLVTKRPQNFRRLLPARWLERMPQNIWGITTVESPAYEWRIVDLLKIDFVVHGVSYEPALAAVDFSPWMRRNGNRLTWLIAGGESQQVHHAARPAHPDWFRAARDAAAANSCAFLFKQWGQWAPGLLNIGNSAAGMRSVGKKEAGRMLDGRTWDEVPLSSLPAIRQWTNCAVNPEN